MLRQTILFCSSLIKCKSYLPYIGLFLGAYCFSAHAEAWQTLAPGIEYMDANKQNLAPWSHIHVFRINLQKNKLDLALATTLAETNASVDTLANTSKALIAINGGFFDKNYHPLGLRISHRQQVSTFKNISWWGIFYIKNNKPYIVAPQQFAKNSAISFAVQSGPRLLVNNRILSLKKGIAERSALGITSDQKVIIVMTENLPISTTRLAKLLRAAPFNCRNALNLDGGSSSQLRANIGDFQLNIHGFSNVSDAVIVQPR